MTVKRNSFAGIASGTAVTPANSGGTSGTAFDAVVLGVGASVVVNTSADLTDTYDRGIVSTVGGGNRESMCQWNHPATNTTYLRFYYRTPAALPAVHVRLARGYSGTTMRWEVRHTSAGTIALVEYVSGGFLAAVETALAVNTVYRIELKIGLTYADCEMRVYLGESNTPALPGVTYPAAQAVAGTWDNTRIGHASGSTAAAYPLEFAALAWSDEGWIGPAVPDLPPPSVSYQLTANYPANSATPTSWTINTAGSVGTVTAVQTGGTTATITEGPTGVFTVTNPAGTDPLTVRLTATSGTAAVANVTIPRGGAGATGTKKMMLTLQSLPATDPANWK